MDFFDKIQRTGKEFVSTVKDMTDTGSTKIKINELERQIEKIYAIIGKKYVSINANNPDDEFSSEIKEINSLRDKILVLKKQINDINNITICPSCNNECDKSSVFCPHCGSKLDRDTKVESLEN